MVKIKHVNQTVKVFRIKLTLSQCQDHGMTQSPQQTSQASGAVATSVRKGSDRLWHVAKEPIVMF